jgi:hypothetical protein
MHASSVRPQLSITSTSPCPALLSASKNTSTLPEWRAGTARPAKGRPGRTAAMPGGAMRSGTSLRMHASATSGVERPAKFSILLLFLARSRSPPDAMRTGGHLLNDRAPPPARCPSTWPRSTARHGLHELRRSHARDDLQKRLRPVAGIPDSLAEEPVGVSLQRCVRSDKEYPLPVIATASPPGTSGSRGEGGSGGRFLTCPWG